MNRQEDLHTETTSTNTDTRADVGADDRIPAGQADPAALNAAVTADVPAPDETLVRTPPRHSEQQANDQGRDLSVKPEAPRPGHRHFSEGRPAEEPPDNAWDQPGTRVAGTDRSDEAPDRETASATSDLAHANETLKRQIADLQRELDGLRKMIQVAADVVLAVPAGLFLFQYQPPGELFFLNCNPEATRLTGLGQDDCRGVELDEIWPNARSQGLIDAFLEAARSGRSFEAGKVLYRNSKIERILRVKAFAIPGERLGVAFLEVTDQSEVEGVLRKVEEEIGARVEQSTLQLVSRNQMLEDECASLKRSRETSLASCRLAAQEELAGRLARVMSSPLENVQEAAQRALARLDSGYMSLMRPALDQIQQEASRLSSLVRYLKQCSGRPPAGGTTQLRLLDLSEIVRTSVAELAAVRADVDANDTTPVCKELALGDDCHVHGEPVAMKDVVDTLLLNALAAIDTPGGVSVKTMAETECVVLEVSDTGDGMSEDDVPLLLEPLGLSKPDRPGLGLAAVSGVVRRYGGNVRVATERGKGTTVTVRLPRAKDS